MKSNNQLKDYLLYSHNSAFMKIIRLLLILLSCSVMTAGQVVTQDDSIRTVVLQEVAVSAKQKNQQQNLYNFFSTNKAATTEDILGRFPELSLVRRGSYGMEPTIRSFNSSQVNLLIDGMRIHGACTDKMDPASIYIEPINLNSIEVNTGGRDFLNGSSIGGNINMKLAEANCHEQPVLNGAVNSGFHSAANTFYQSLSVDYAGSRWGLRASGTYRKSGDYRDGSGKTVSFSQYEKVNYSINGKLVLSDRSYLKIDLLADDGWNMGYAALPMDVGYANARIGAVSVIKEDPSARWEKLEAKLYANKIKHFMDDTDRPNVTIHMDMPGESITTGFYAEGTKKARRGKLSLRADASATTLKASMTMHQPGQSPMYMLTWPDNRQVQSGVAAQYAMRIDSITQLILNARTDISAYSLTSQMGKDQLAVFNYTDDNNHFYIPSISMQVSRRLIGKLKAALSVGINGRSPSASELFGFYLFNQFDGYDYIGKPTLEQETGMLTDLTLSYQQQKWKAQATAYVSRVKNYIIGRLTPDFSAMTIGAKGVKQYANIDHAVLAGAEASLVYEPSTKTQFVTTVKYAFGNDDLGKPLPMITPLRNISTLRQFFGNLWLQGEAEFAATQNRVSKVADEKATGSFALYHFRAGYKQKVKNLDCQLNAGIENIFDVHYREHLDWGNIARPGRNLYLQLGFAF